jgi:hypothetical protein
MDILNCSEGLKPAYRTTQKKINHWRFSHGHPDGNEQHMIHDLKNEENLDSHFAKLNQGARIPMG